MNAAPILYVEDEENDVLLMQFAWKTANISNPLRIVTNGEEALAYLSGTGKYSQRTEHPLPCLVLLDLNLPKVSGLDVLKWIREQPSIQTLPVIVFSSSNRPADVRAAYARGANSYLVKPSAADGLNELVVFLRDYWLRTNRLPS